MTAPTILARLNAAGVRVRRRGDNLLAEPKAAVTEPLLILMRAHKRELLAALSDQPSIAPAAAATNAPDARYQLVAGVYIPETAARRQRLRVMLERDPEAHYAVLTADDGTGPVIVSIAIRDAATTDFEIDHCRIDGMTFLELFERQGRLH